MCEDLTAKEGSIPLIDQTEDSDPEFPWKDSKRMQAVKLINRLL